MTTQEQYRRILSNHLPPQAVDWVYSYLDRHRVHFHITRQRTSKLGDYRWPQAAGGHDYHEISVNGDLNRYLFLWVFLHEAAHLETHLKHPGAAPHGHEWQGEYARLIADHAHCFPPEVHDLLARYVRRIPLSRPLLRQIEETLHHHDDGYRPEEHQTLDRLLAGRPNPTDIRFRLKSRPDMELLPLERRRTRWLCLEPATGRRYTVSANAEITLNQDN